MHRLKVDARRVLIHKGVLLKEIRLVDYDVKILVLCTNACDNYALGLCKIKTM
jgi:hypothetical protein